MVSFTKANEGNNVVSLNFTPDAYGDEISWNIMDSSGVNLAYGGPYTAGDLTLISTTITLPA
ncbi:MAG: hypothetical protein H7174_04695 [Flavobacterium sp.]|nr:hypothetical protein [Flavobacterium sp.]